MADGIVNRWGGPMSQFMYLDGWLLFQVVYLVVLVVPISSCRRFGVRYSIRIIRVYFCSSFSLSVSLSLSVSPRFYLSLFLCPFPILYHVDIPFIYSCRWATSVGGQWLQSILFHFTLFSPYLKCCAPLFHSLHNSFLFTLVYRNLNVNVECLHRCSLLLSIGIGPVPQNSVKKKPVSPIPDITSTASHVMKYAGFYAISNSVKSPNSIDRRLEDKGELTYRRPSTLPLCCANLHGIPL